MARTSRWAWSLSVRAFGLLGASHGGRFLRAGWRWRQWDWRCSRSRLQQRRRCFARWFGYIIGGAHGAEFGASGLARVFAAGDGQRSILCRLSGAGGRDLGGLGCAAIGRVRSFSRATLLVWHHERVLIDAPCSGLQMAWLARLLALVLANLYSLRAKSTLSLLAFCAAVTFGANVLRAAILFLLETQLHVSAGSGCTMASGLCFLPVWSAWCWRTRRRIVIGLTNRVQTSRRSRVAGKNRNRQFWLVSGLSKTYFCHARRRRSWAFRDCRGLCFLGRPRGGAALLTPDPLHRTKRNRGFFPAGRQRRSTRHSEKFHSMPRRSASRPIFPASWRFFLTGSIPGSYAGFIGRPASCIHRAIACELRAIAWCQAARSWMARTRFGLRSMRSAMARTCGCASALSARGSRDRCFRVVLGTFFMLRLRAVVGDHGNRAAADVGGFELRPSLIQTATVEF